MDYSKFGIAALIPGMQHMIDLMQTELDKMRTIISEDSKKIKKKNSKISEYWKRMTSEERSAEVTRRLKVRIKNKKASAA